MSFLLERDAVNGKEGRGFMTIDGEKMCIRDRATAMQELKQLSDETGLYGKVSDEAVEAGRGVFYSDSRLRDPMSGLEFPGNPEEGGGGLEDDEEDPAGEGN